MKWITRCTACGVTYTVVSDQLKVAQGWLRCGQCQHAFDSTGLVLKWVPEACNPEPTWATEKTAERLDIDDLLMQEDRSAPQSAVTAFEEALSNFKAQPLTSTPTAPPAEVFGMPLGALLTPNAVPEDQPAVLTPPSPFGWPMVVVWSLLLALALQWIWAGRYPLMAVEPSLAKPFESVCRLLGCEMVPPAVPEGVVIENSSMTPRDGGLALLWSVRNVTPQTVEMPALELTWLDAQDKTLVRRVLQPTEQNAPSALAPGQVWSGQLLLLPTEGLQPLGYRLAIFYP